MTVDRDLLADYLGGALEGTPEHARVARLIATDSDWAEAAGAMSAALAAVETDLAALPPPTMPAEVVARLDAVLTGTGAGVPTPRSAPGTTGRGATGPLLPGPGRSGPGAAGRNRPGSVRPAGRARRRLLRWSGGLVAAAAVLGFAAFGYPELAGLPSGTGGSSPAADQAPAEAGTAGSDTDEPVLLASGADYRPEQLAAGPPMTAITTDEGAQVQPERPTDPSPLSGPQVMDEPVRVPPELTRLWSDPPRWAACLAAVRDAAPAGPVEIGVVDFARFQGAPAIVIWLTDASGDPGVVVVGPDCGDPEAGADERFRS